MNFSDDIHAVDDFAKGSKTLHVSITFTLVIETGLIAKDDKNSVLAVPTASLAMDITPSVCNMPLCSVVFMRYGHEFISPVSEAP